MEKILALDIGDRWVGSALSDSLLLLAKPYKTVPTHELETFLKKALEEEKIKEIVIGHPRTMKGTESEQTKKVIASKEKLEKNIPDIPFLLWDERLTSKRAEKLQKGRSKEEKLKSHSIAAAFILESYLTYLKNK